MNKVPYDEVKGYFQAIWANSAEPLFHEIAWDCLEKAGLTSYENGKTHALIHVYAYVIQMLCEEFSYFAYDETCNYDYEGPDEEPLTDAAIGWLYRDVIDTIGYANLDDCFSTSASEMLSELVGELRHVVADVLFDQLRQPPIESLLYYSIMWKPSRTSTGNASCIENQPFQTKEALLHYCANEDFCIEDVFDFSHASGILHWLSCRSCATDD